MLATIEPKDFFRLIHPCGGSVGSVVVERRIHTRTNSALVSQRDLERIARVGYDVEGLSFSSASYHGYRFLLNLASLRCLSIKIHPERPSAWLAILKVCEEAQILTPSAVIETGDSLVLIWLLDRPYQSWEFHLAYLYQRALNKIFSPHFRCNEYIEAAPTIPLVGSLDPISKQHITIIRGTGRSYSRHAIEDELTSYLDPKDFRQAYRHGGTIRELQALLSSRFMSLSLALERYDDWLVFFGASLRFFASPMETQKELRALAVSLEASYWSDIKDKYEHLIASLGEGAQKTPDWFMHDGSTHSVGHPAWFDLIKHRLEITDQEIQELGLHVLAGTSDTSPLLSASRAHIMAVGNDESYRSIEALLLKTIRSA